MTRPGIEPRSPGRLANTLTARPMSGINRNVYILPPFFDGALNTMTVSHARLIYLINGYSEYSTKLYQMVSQ